MPYVTSIERFGLAKGLEKGRQEEGIRLLQRKFGEIPSWAEKRLAAGTLDEVERWSERLLDALILEDVFI